MNSEKIWANKYEITKAYIGRLPHSSDLLEEINNFCAQNNVKKGVINIIGAVKQAKLGYYIQDKQEYIIINEEKLNSGLEIVSCTGNISIKDAKPFAHLHIIVSDRESCTYGGHLMPGTIVYAGEFIIQEFAGEDLVRSIDKTTGLPLWKKLFD